MKQASLLAEWWRNKTAEHRATTQSQLSEADTRTVVEFHHRGEKTKHVFREKTFNLYFIFHWKKKRKKKPKTFGSDTSVLNLFTWTKMEIFLQGWKKTFFLLLFFSSCTHVTGRMLVLPKKQKTKNYLWWPWCLQCYKGRLCDWNALLSLVLQVQVHTAPCPGRKSTLFTSLRARTFCIIFKPAGIWFKK